MRLFRNGSGGVPNDGAKGECDKAAKKVDFIGSLWCEGSRCGGRTTGGRDVDVEESKYGNVRLFGCGAEQEGCEE